MLSVLPLAFNLN